MRSTPIALVEEQQSRSLRDCFFLCYFSGFEEPGSQSVADRAQQTDGLANSTQAIHLCLHSALPPKTGMLYIQGANAGYHCSNNLIKVTQRVPEGRNSMETKEMRFDYIIKLKSFTGAWLKTSLTSDFHFILIISL